MDLNGISCGGHRFSKNQVVFSLYDTTFEAVAALNNQKLTLTVSETNKSVYDGYQISEINVNENDISVAFVKKLDDSTAQSINALEENYEYLNNLVATNQNYTSIALESVGNVIATMLMRANLTDREAFNCQTFYPEWQVGIDYKKDWIVQYDGSLYRIGQDHTSQEQWVPGADGTTALYSKIEITEGGYEVWQEWDGVSGSYANGQIVQDPTDERLYKSLIDNNVWGPPSEQPDYWELYIES